MVDFNKTPYLYRVTLDAEKSSSDSKTGHCYFVLDGKTKLIPYDQFEFYSREQLTKEEVIKKCEGSHIIRVSGDFRPIDPKYYTPSLKEFHSGFEYEYFVEGINEWSKEVFYLNESHIDLVKYVEADKLPKVRCKHLDKIDMGDLGFEILQKPDGSFEYEFNLKWKGSSIGTVTFNKDGSIDELYIYLTIFKLKNKSELSKLMGFLSIK